MRCMALALCLANLPVLANDDGGMGLGPVIGAAGLATLGGGMTTSALVVSDADMGVISAVLAVGAAVTTSAGATILRKELVNQVKIDHETYLAGGEMSPFLRAIYSDVCSSMSHLLTAGTLDEEKMTRAIDRLVALAILSP